MDASKEVKVTTKYQRVSPRKMRLVARNVTGYGLQEVMSILRFTPNKSAAILLKTVASASANAKSLHGYDLDDLYLKEVLVNEGPSWKRFLPRAQGRATKIHKRMSHITVILALSDEQGGE